MAEKESKIKELKERLKGMDISVSFKFFGIEICLKNNPKNNIVLKEKLENKKVDLLVASNKFSSIIDDTFAIVSPGVECEIDDEYDYVYEKIMECIEKNVNYVVEVEKCVKYLETLVREDDDVACLFTNNQKEIIDIFRNIHREFACAYERITNNEDYEYEEAAELCISTYYLLKKMLKFVEDEITKGK